MPDTAAGRAVLLFALILPCGIAHAEQTVVVGERVPVILVARGATDAFPSAVVAETVKRTTSLRVLFPEQVGLSDGDLERCDERERLGCWSRRIAELKAGRYLVLMSVVPGPDGVEVSMFFVDCQLAIEIDASERRESHSSDAVEAAIWKGAVKVAEEHLALIDTAAFTRFVERALEEKLKPLLEHNGDWRRIADVQIDAPERGLSVQIDGRSIGVTDDETVTITGVATGRRKISLVAKDDRRFDTEVELVPGAVQPIRALLPPPPKIAPLGPSYVFYTGIGVATVGAGLVVAALARPRRSSDLALCDGVPCGREARSFTSFCELFAGDIQSCARQGGLKVAPLGLGLLVAGATFSIGSATIERDESWPLWSLIAGVLLAPLTYALSAAIAR